MFFHSIIYLLFFCWHFILGYLCLHALFFWLPFYCFFFYAPQMLLISRTFVTQLLQKVQALSQQLIYPSNFFFLPANTLDSWQLRAVRLWVYEYKLIPVKDTKYFYLYHIIRDILVVFYYLPWKICGPFWRYSYETSGRYLFISLTIVTSYCYFFFFFYVHYIYYVFFVFYIFFILCKHPLESMHCSYYESYSAAVYNWLYHSTHEWDQKQPVLAGALYRHHDFQQIRLNTDYYGFIEHRGKRVNYSYRILLGRSVLTYSFYIANVINFFS